jgi:antitoxin HigA-1
MVNKKTGKRRPTSPGHIIRLDYLNTLNMGVRSFARHMGVSRLTALALLDGRIAIDARLAIRLSVVFNTTSDLWLGLQHAIDIWDVNNTKETIIAAMGHQPTAYKKAEFISVPTHLPIVTATPNVNSKHVEHNTIHDNQCLVPLENFYVGSDLNDKFIDDKLTIKDLAKIVNHINIILSQKP